MRMTFPSPTSSRPAVRKPVTVRLLETGETTPAFGSRIRSRNEDRRAAVGNLSHGPRHLRPGNLADPGRRTSSQRAGVLGRAIAAATVCAGDGRFSIRLRDPGAAALA